MRNLMIMGMLALLATTSNAQVNPKIVYDLHKNSYTIADISATSFSINLKGKQLVVPVKAFGGTSMTNGALVGGFKTGIEVMLAKVVSSDSSSFMAGQKVFLNLDVAYLTSFQLNGQVRLFFGVGVK